MKILIIEDEEHGYLRLKHMLQNIDCTFTIDGPLTTCNSVVEYFKSKHDEDIVFADIKLGDGDIFQAFSEIKITSPVIYTTAYNEYALEAYKNNGIAYLQKPIITNELITALEKAKSMCNKKDVYTSILEIIGHSSNKKWREHFLVNTNDGYKLVKTKDIKYFFTENGIVRGYTDNRHSVQLDTSLNDLEQQLDPNVFFRANRQHIININSIDKLTNFFHYKIAITLHGFPESRIYVSKDRITKLKDWLNK